jgi:rhodanese-related sulfurtransferase
MKNLRVSELSAFIQENKDVQLIDVRTIGEYSSGAIAGFQNLPLDRLSIDAQSLDPQKPIVIMCHSGSRSLMASRMLEMSGFSNVYNLVGGYMAF